MSKTKRFLISDAHGLSAVVVTLLLILLSIAALAIVWAVISNILSSQSGQASSGIAGLLLNLKIERVDLSTPGTIPVTITRKSGAGDLVGMKVIFSDGKNSESFENFTSLNEQDTKTIDFTLSQLTQSNLKSVSVAPIYKSGNGNVTGSITDTYLITAGGTQGGGTQGSETQGGGTQGGGNPEAVCGNGVCESGETSASCPSDCETGGTILTCGNSAIDSGEECDGGSFCNVDCTCQSGYIPTDPVSIDCRADFVLNSGTLDSVWPPGAVKYADSQNLPQDPVVISGYIGKYIRFTPETNPKCLRITYAEYLSDPDYNKSYVRIETVAPISSGDAYEIWNTQEGCNNL